MRPRAMRVAIGIVSNVPTAATNVRSIVSAPAPRVCLNSRPGLGRRPAWTQSASAMPSSRTVARNARLDSNATSTAASAVSGSASSASTRRWTASSLRGSGAETSMPRRSWVTAATRSKPWSSVMVAQPPEAMAMQATTAMRAGVMERAHAGDAPRGIG